MRTLRYTGEGTFSSDAESNPSCIEDAFDLLLSDTIQFFDLEDSKTSTLLQVALFDSRYEIQIFLGLEKDETSGLFCARNGVSREIALSSAKQFASTGTYDKNLFPFSTPPDEEIKLPLPPKYRPSSSSMLKRKIEKNPQKYLESALEDFFYQSNLSNFQYAIELGASLKRCKPYPPLVYHALKFGNKEAIPFFISLGCDVNETHAGKSIIWHAITNRNFAYASTLALHGAAIETAQSSTEYQDWEVYEAEQNILRAIECGDKGFLANKIQNFTKNRIKLDWLKHAVVSDQFEILQMLLDKKGKVRLDVPTPYSVYGRALVNGDARYLASLIKHGAYESVVENLDTDSIMAGLLFKKASPQCLSYLQSNGYTFGFHEGVREIVRNQAERTESQLNVIEDKWLRKLDVSDFLTVVRFLMDRGCSERVTRLLEGMDNARLLSDACDLGDLFKLSFLVQAGAELAVVTSKNQDQRSIGCRQFIRRTRTTIIELLEEVAAVESSDTARHQPC